jgi:tetratricopeptide (TPR) repeat protein
VYEKTADLEAFTGDPPAAVKTAGHALAIFKTLADSAPTDVVARRSLAISHLKLGDISGNPSFPNAGDAQGALRSYRSAAAILESLHAENSADAATRRYLGMIYERIGTMLTDMEDFPGALASFRTSLQIRGALAREQRASMEAQRDLGVAHEKIGMVLRRRGEHAAALESAAASLTIFEQLAAADPVSPYAARSVSISLEHYADLLSEAGQTTQAIPVYERIVKIRNRLVTTSPGNVQHPPDLARAESKLGDAHIKLADETRSPAVANQHRRAAHSAYERSLRVWADIRRAGNLKSDDAEQVKQVEEKLRSDPRS